MMSKTRKISKIGVVILIIIILISLFMMVFIIKQQEQKTNILNNEYIYKINENIEVNNTLINNLKENYGITGNTDIYEVREEIDGSDVLTVKAGIKYKVAFAGMIKSSKPELSELEQILQEHPTKTGIWIEKDSRNKIITFLKDNKNINSRYDIDEEGYLKIQEKNNQTEYDKNIEKYINSERTYLLNISSLCYIVDDITGEILDYSFEKMYKYQIYEYFKKRR